MFDTARYGKPGMHRGLVGRSVVRSIAEHQAVAFTPADLKADGREGSLATIVIVIEIDQKGEHSLLSCRDIGKSVAVRTILLPGCIAQNLHRFAGSNVGPARGG